MYMKVDETRIDRRIETRYCDVKVKTLDEALERAEQAKEKGQPLSIGLLGNAAELVLSVDAEQEVKRLNQADWQACMGKVGSMEAHKVVAAVETAAKKNGLIKTGIYRESHALYHAIMEALQGVTRGQVQLGSVHRTVGINQQYAHVAENARLDRMNILKHLEDISVEHDVSSWKREYEQKLEQAEIFEQVFQKYCWRTS